MKSTQNMNLLIDIVWKGGVKRWLDSIQITKNHNNEFEFK